MKNIIIILFGLILIVSCNSQNGNTKTKKELKKEKTETILGNFGVLQSKNIEKARETLIVVIDPHGDGKFALTKFRGVVKKYECTIIGLNNVENNQPDYIQKIENDIRSAKNKYKLNPKHFFITGFSGGARMAFQYAVSHKVNGVMMCGAGINMQKISELNFPLVMITGIKDFNFIEQYYSPYSPVVKNKNILTLIIDGIHEWPPEDDILTGVSFLFGRNDEGTENLNLYSKKAEKYLKGKDYFKVLKMYEASFKIGNKDAEQRISELLKDKEFQEFIKYYEASLQKELDRNNMYIRYFQSKNISFWQNEVLKINKLMKSKDKYEAESYSRTKAYLGVAMYSFVNKEILNPWSKLIDKYLKIYEYLEPENPDLWFFNSVREKQKNNSVLSEKYLKRAFVFGFKDRLKAKQYGLINE